MQVVERGAIVAMETGRVCLKKGWITLEQRQQVQQPNCTPFVNPAIRWNGFCTSKPVRMMAVTMLWKKPVGTSWPPPMEFPMAFAQCGPHRGIFWSRGTAVPRLHLRFSPF
jgi:hypothetical protein